MRLRKGDVLVKKRGGASKRVTVGAIVTRRDFDGVQMVTVRSARLDSDAKANSKHTNARQWWVPLGDDGLPEGYRRAES